MLTRRVLLGTAAALPVSAAWAQDHTTHQLAQAGGGQRHPSPPGAYCYIGWPNDGERVSSSRPFLVWFGTRNFGVAPAGVSKDKTGHHHLLIDVDPKTINYNEEIPNDKTHLHFGKGQTQTHIQPGQLSPGRHTLMLLMGDENHVPHDPPVKSKLITITVV